MFRTQNLCPGSKNVFDSMAKTFFVSEQQNLFPQHMFPARLNWETFASATMFPSLARPLDSRSRRRTSTRFDCPFLAKKLSLRKFITRTINLYLSAVEIAQLFVLQVTYLFC